MMLGKEKLTRLDITKSYTTVSYKASILLDLLYLMNFILSMNNSYSIALSNASSAQRLWYSEPFDLLNYTFELQCR